MSIRGSPSAPVSVETAALPAAPGASGESMCLSGTGMTTAVPSEAGAGTEHVTPLAVSGAEQPPPDAAADSTNPRVSFHPDLHVPPASGIPAGWFALGQGNSLGELEGTIVSRDGVIYTAETVEIDLSVPDRPLWRFRRSRGTQQESEKGLIPVRRTYRGLFEFLQAPPMSAREWQGQSLVPAAAHSGRSFTVGLDDDSLLGSFFGQGVDWYRSLVRGERPVWPEATGLATVIPDSISHLSASAFADLFARRAFEAADGNRQLEVERLDPLPKELCSAEFLSRKEFLHALNVSAGLESILLQHKAQDSEVGPLSAAVKMSLPHLWKAFLAFGQAKLDLRRAALSRCDLNGQRARRLIQSTPFSPDLFGDEEVQELKDASLRQAKSILTLLSFSFAKRPASSANLPAGRGKRLARSPHRGRGNSVPGRGRGRGRGRGKTPPRFLTQPQPQLVQPVSVGQLMGQQPYPSVVPLMQLPPGQQYVQMGPVRFSAPSPGRRGRGRGRGRGRASSPSPQARPGAAYHQQQQNF